jgi:hypothetical protein
MIAFFQDCFTKIMSEMLLNHNGARPYMIVCTMEAITNFGQAVLPHSLYNPGMALSHNHLCGPSERACEDTIMPVQRYCWILYTSVCRGERGIFTRQVYMLLFKDGRRLLTNLETILKNNCAIVSSIVKFSEISMCSTCKLHEMKNGGITFWLSLVQMV